MGRIERGPRNGQMKRKGQAGAAKNYITRNQALKKLQVTLGDFRRLCILKGIYPREPRSRKKANKGSTAPASFYYQKDIQYLLHEPVLGKLREHKAFAKKLSRAIGRGEWGLAKNLESSKPVYRIDHIIKERYPTFTDSLRDLDDALSLVVLFASLPATTTIPASIIANCTRLAAQWQLYVMRTRALRKVFLSIKGIYFQAEVQGQTVTWLVPYMFTQHIPSDLDFRIMLTFLELYQTLLGFVFFKLFADINLVYPPQLDAVLDENGAGIGALLLEESGKGLVVERGESAEDADRKRVFAKDVRSKIKEIAAAPDAVDESVVAEEDRVAAALAAATAPAEIELDVFPTAAGAAGEDGALEVYSPAQTGLLTNYHFFLSREVTRPTLEFVIRSFGGQVGWDPTLGAGSPFKEDDPRVTHHIVDRPVAPGAAPRSHPGKRAYVQPQWVVDCVNKQTLLPTDEYAPGKVLPPHLSPFVDEDAVRQRGGYVPMEASRRVADRDDLDEDMSDDDEDDEDEDEDEDEDMSEDDEEEKRAVNKAPVVGLGKKKGRAAAPALLAAAQDPTNEALLHAAELEAEARGVAPAVFSAELAAEAKKARRAGGQGPAKVVRSQEEQLAAIMLTGKQKKLYNQMVYSTDRRKEETLKLEQRKKQIDANKRKEARKVNV